MFCKYCKIHVSGDRKRCPLCQNPLYGEPDPDSSLFPNVSPKAWKIQKLILHSFLFVSFAVVVICLTVDALLPESHSYPWYVAGAVLCMCFWLVLYTEDIIFLRIFYGLLYGFPCFLWPGTPAPAGNTGLLIMSFQLYVSRQWLLSPLFPRLWAGV